ncbi:hypothetical protein [Neobacillus dielmonensis]|uniref:hypothetical protein n=1 Tax=Neobacillus dielmonensis TaxID=1347369 RepID=UPI0005A7BA06|nr:hypothetical protein [Neobacillus dielmonensis]
MSAFQGLVKKDFAISKVWFFSWIILISLILCLPMALEIYLHSPLSFLPMVVVLVLLFHAVFLPCMLLSMLRLEGKTQLWLYNPQSSRSLLLSKLTVSLVYQVVAQIYLTAVGLVIYHFYKNEIHIESSDLFDGAVIANAGLLLFSLYVSCWALLYWTIFHSLNKFPAIKNWRWLVILLLFFVYNAISTFFGKIEPLKEFVHKWTIPVLAGVHTSYKQDGWEIRLNAMDIPVLGILLYALIAIVLFLISCWLLDRKVEV